MTARQPMGSGKYIPALSAGVEVRPSTSSGRPCGKESRNAQPETPFSLLLSPSVVHLIPGLPDEEFDRACPELVEGLAVDNRQTRWEMLLRRIRQSSRQGSRQRQRCRDLRHSNSQLETRPSKLSRLPHSLLSFNRSPPLLSFRAEYPKGFGRKQHVQDSSERSLRPVPLCRRAKFYSDRTPIHGV